MDLALFTYPWDIARVGPVQYVEEVAALGVTTIAVATVYHSAEVITPRWSTDALVTAEPGVSHIPLDKERFADVSPPAGSLTRSHPDLYHELKEAAAAAGLRTMGWTVALHQTTLATANPDLALRTCFGDVNTHGLCPANSRVVRYVTDLVDAVAGTEVFDELLLESIAYLPVGHGHPHELWAARFDEVTRGLLSLCFCESCMAAAKDRGIDAQSVRGWVADELDRGWNGPLSVARNDDDASETLGVLLGNDDLLEYVRMRVEVVAQLAGQAAGSAQEAGIPLALASPVWARPLWTSWLQGVDPGRLGAIADVYGLQAYYADPGLVARELDHALRFVSANKLLLMQTLMRDHHRSPAELTAKVETAVGAGVERFSLYNYGMAPQPVLQWVAEVAGVLGTI